MGAVRKALLFLFTEKDNQTLCPLRVFGIPFAIILSNVFIGLSVYNVVALRQPFDYVSFGTGAGLIWGSVSAAIVGKAKWGESDIHNSKE